MKVRNCVFKLIGRKESWSIFEKRSLVLRFGNVNLIGVFKMSVGKVFRMVLRMIIRVKIRVVVLGFKRKE